MFKEHYDNDDDLRSMADDASLSVPRRAPSSKHGYCYGSYDGDRCRVRLLSRHTAHVSIPYDDDDDGGTSTARRRPILAIRPSVVSVRTTGRQSGAAGGWTGRHGAELTGDRPATDWRSGSDSNSY